MNKTTISLFLLLLAVSPLQSGVPAVQTQFEQANRLYESGRYHEALDLYQQISAAGVRSWKLFFNLGNCCFKQERFLEAKVFYLKARKIRSADSAIAHNIAIVNRKFRDRQAPARNDFFSRLDAAAEAALTVNALALLLLALVFPLNFFIFRLQRKARSRVTVYGLAISLLLAAATALYLRHRITRLEAVRIAVVRAEKSELRSGPGVDNTVLFEVHPGLEVRIGDRRRDWCQVAATPVSGSQVAGWIETNQLLPI